MYKRNMDGVYFRVQRDNKWDNICFSDLTYEEKESVMQGRDIDWLKSLCITLANRLAEIGEQLDMMYGD